MNGLNQTSGISVFSIDHPKRKGSGVRAMALLIALLICFCSTACTSEPVVISDLNFVSADGLSVYSVVYSATTATPEVVFAAQQLHDALETTIGCEVELTDDQSSFNSDYSYEILVGDVDRTVVPSVKALLGADQFTVRVSGHKIVLLGTNNRATLEAVAYFMANVLRCDSPQTATPNPDLSIPQNYRHTFACALPNVPVLKADTVLPVSPYLPTELNVIACPERKCDALTLATLQGLSALFSGEQIWIDTPALEQTLALLAKPAPGGYGVTLYTTDPAGQEWTLVSLMQRYAPRLDGYILCDADLNSKSASIAVSLARQLSAVVVTPDNVQSAIDAGLTLVLDVRGKDMIWFYGSRYFNALSREVAVEQSAQLAPMLVDYAVMSGALLVAYNAEDSYLHAQAVRYLNDGAVVLGENEMQGEYRTMQTLSSLNANYIPARQCYNLSVLSGFARDGLTPAASAQPEAPSQTESTDAAKAGHTVCILLSEGENLDFWTNGILSDEMRYGSPQRGNFAMNWGIPASMSELAHPVLSTLAAARTPNDHFILQTSGVGAGFPSLWDTDELQKMATQLNALMNSMDVRCLQVTDVGEMDVNSLSVLAAQDAVDGIFYHDYNYEYMDGEVLWLNDVPVVPVDYRLWAGIHTGTIEYVAESINSASTDPSKPTAYSVVMVHAWSGLDDNGHLVSGGDTMEAVAALVSALDADVEVVGAEEMIARMVANLRNARAEVTP